MLPKILNAELKKIFAIGIRIESSDQLFLIRNSMRLDVINRKKGSHEFNYAD